MIRWVLIDDNPDEAMAYSESLSEGDGLVVDHLSASDATKALESGELKPAGVLMDVDLSNELGQRQTGPGIAQDMRVAQQKQVLAPFPIVRFSLRSKIRENIGSDSSSDDIFDLKIEKDGLSNSALRESTRQKLVGVSQLYKKVEACGGNFEGLLNINKDTWALWGSSGFQSDFEQGDRVHLQVSPVIRMLVHPGLLIDEDILAFRLGLDRGKSTGWSSILDSVAPYRYRGVANSSFPRWWAHGIEQWWQDELGAESPLAGCNIEERNAILSKFIENLVPLEMPPGSMGDRPWRYCLLTFEQRGELIPVDPSKSVKMKPRSPMPTWLDPLYSSLGAALENRGDARLDKPDLNRLQKLVR